MISAGASTIIQTAAVLENTVYYASGSFLTVWNLSKMAVTAMLDMGSRITAVEAGDTFLLVGTQKGTVLSVDARSLEVTEPVFTFKKAVTCLAVDGSTVAAGSADGTIAYKQGNGPTKTLQISARFYPLGLALASNFLATGGTSGSVFLVDLETQEKVEMQGHENWIHTLDFWKEENGDLVLASGAQDRYIRLWRVSKQAVEEDPLKNGLSTKVHHLAGYNAYFEALLIGHDDWVVSVRWDSEKFRLLSASSDSSLIVWEADPATTGADAEGYEVWSPQIRLGDVAIMGASTATGASGGFWTALWLPEHVATVSKSGSWRLWTRNEWISTAGISGHTKTVTSVAWLGDNLLSTSLDQTTRLWRNDVEMSRPQIHGYDITDCAPITNQMFLSAADEKTSRVFAMPQAVATLLGSAETDLPTASVPALGLSNKADDGVARADLDLDNGSRPREEHLQRLTLWPEVEKLYGHGYEASCVDVSRNGSLLATCCKATTPQHAVVRIYDTSRWRQLEPLAGHTLTITRARFSPSGTHLLTVSRDRQFIVFSVEEMAAVHTQPKAHTRIIWDCCWLSDTEFITVSRDKTARKWSITGELLQTVPLPDVGTACDCDQKHVVVGLENGTVLLFNRDLEETARFQAEGRVNRLALHNNTLAVASESVRTIALN